MCVQSVLFERFIQSFIIKPPSPPPYVVTPLTLGMAVAIRCDCGIVFHHCTVSVAFSKCDLSLKLVVAVAPRHGVVILLSVLSGRAKPTFSQPMVWMFEGFFPVYCGLVFLSLCRITFLLCGWCFSALVYCWWDLKIEIERLFQVSYEM